MLATGLELPPESAVRRPRTREGIYAGRWFRNSAERYEL
jgi:hypothetical protein